MNMAMMHNGLARGRVGRGVAWSAGAAMLAAACAFAAPAAADDDVTIDNLAFKSLDGDSFVIAHVAFINTNLSKEDVVKLLTPDTPVDDERALAQELTADKIAIPSIDILGKDGSKIHLSNLTISHVDAGRIEALDLASIEATETDKGGAVTVKSGTMHLEDLDVAQLLSDGDADNAKSTPSRLGGMTLIGLDIVAPDPGEPAGQSIHVAVGSIEVHNQYAGDSIKQGDAKIAGIVIEPSAGSDAAKTLASLGYSKVELATTFAAKYQADAKSFALDNLTFDGVQMGSVGLKANFTDVSPQLFGADSAGRMQALFDAGVASIEIKLVNGGMFEKALAFAAKQQGLSPDKLRAQWSAMVGQTAPVLLGGSPASLALAAEAQKFVADPKNLTISAKAKSGALKASDFMTIGDPTEFAGKLDISAAANR
jgi:hypothetical protein